MLTIGVIQISFDCTFFKVYADEVNYEQALKEYCEGNPLDGYLFIQEQEDTGILNSELEAELNAQGIFDSEIMNMSEEDIDCIETADKVYIETQYVQYVYTGEELSSDIEEDKIQYFKNKNEIINENVEISEGQEVIDDYLNINRLSKSCLPYGYEAKIMSEDEVDELIEELYFNEESNNGDNVLNKILTGIGVKPQTVYAKTKVGSDRQESSYLKKILIVCQVDNKVRVNFNCIWMKTPANTLVDLVSLQWMGGSRILNDSSHLYSASISYKKTKSVEFSYGEKKILTTETIEKDYSSQFRRNWEPSAVVVAFELPDEYLYDENGMRYIVNYSNITTKISFWLTCNGSAIDVRANYQHQKSKFKFNSDNFFNTAAYVVSFIGTPSNIAKGIIGVATIKSGTNIIYTEKYYDSCGGEPCNVEFSYK